MVNSSGNACAARQYSAESIKQTKYKKLDTSKYLKVFPYKIKGIPCQIAVLSCLVKEPDINSWESDWDYYGYKEIEFNIYDRKGYRADWLANKLTPSIEDAIELKILEIMNDY